MQRIEFPFTYEPTFTTDGAAPNDFNTVGVLVVSCSSILQARAANGSDWYVEELFVQGPCWSQQTDRVMDAWAPLVDDGTHNVHLFRAISAYLHQTHDDDIRAAFVDAHLAVSVGQPSAPVTAEVRP